MFGRTKIVLYAIAFLFLAASSRIRADAIPLPENPRPDFERGEWLSLNGPWSFRFDRGDAGEKESWFAKGLEAFPEKIQVPFPWGHDLEDDPADHRGILSWHSQKRDRKLREAGSYGYLVVDSIPPEALRAAAETKEIVLRLEVDPALPGGLAIYGERFGRYPLDPTLTFELR